ncbi:hypothetical protein [Actinoplanes sp. GCM10030250]|uniref:hypothetical protein n=1 Tax=Actinoplanes sp. GCM10030250 TaxID=3273376 RepID=UPI003620E20B
MNDQSPSGTKSLSQFLDEIQAHSATIADKKWKSLHLMCRIFEANLADFNELMTWATTQQNAVEIVQNARPSTVQEEFFFQLAKETHNLGASVGSLIDHTRRLVESYPAGKFRTEYETRKDLVAKSDCAAFVKNFRNYMLHYDVPPFAFQFSVRNTPQGQIEEARVQLDSAKLLAWSSWTTAAKNYIEGSGSRVDLAKTFTDYSQLIRDLYTWLMSQFETLHGTEIQDANALISEARRSYGFEDSPDI